MASLYWLCLHLQTSAKCGRKLLDAIKILIPRQLPAPLDNDSSINLEYWMTLHLIYLFPFLFISYIYLLTSICISNNVFSLQTTGLIYRLHYLCSQHVYHLGKAWICIIDALSTSKPYWRVPILDIDIKT